MCFALYTIGDLDVERAMKIYIRKIYNPEKVESLRDSLELHL